MVICDGFTGNIALKTAEAMGKILKKPPFFLFNSLKKERPHKKKLRPLPTETDKRKDSRPFGILSNGTEEGKGTLSQKKLLEELWKEVPKKCKGNVEPNDLFSENGNGESVDTIFASPAGIKFMKDIQNIFSKYRGRILKDYIINNPGSAELIGIKKLVFIGHGTSDAKDTAAGLKNTVKITKKKKAQNT